MSGSVTLSEYEKRELLQDAKNVQRGKMELVEFVPSKRITRKFKL